MNMLTIGLSSIDDAKKRLASAFSGQKSGAYISFSSVDLLWRVLTPKRWQILQVMTGAGALTTREIARRVHRDVKAVHGDVHALLEAGVLERSQNTGTVFPYDSIHVDFEVRAA